MKMNLTISDFPQPIKLIASDETRDLLLENAKKGKIVRISIATCCAETSVGLFSKKYIREGDILVGMIDEKIPYYASQELIKELDRIKRLNNLLIVHAEHQKGFRSIIFNFKFGEKGEPI
ncbi:MAG: hypothetical protein ACFFC7_14030 [Candidatus Hermodarchaeota archaeon]